MKPLRHNTFLFQFWERALHILTYISLFRLVRKLPFNTTFSADLWVVFNFIFAIFSLFFLNIGLIIYGIIRVTEIVVYHTNVMFFEHYRHHKSQRKFNVISYHRTILVVLHNFLEMVFWYALFYQYLATQFIVPSGGLALNTAWGSLYYSLVCVTTLGFGDITPITALTGLLTTSQTMLGLFFMLLMLSYFVSLLPKPGTFSDFEKR